MLKDEFVLVNLGNRLTEVPIYTKCNFEIVSVEGELRGRKATEVLLAQACINLLRVGYAITRIEISEKDNFLLFLESSDGVCKMSYRMIGFHGIFAGIGQSAHIKIDGNGLQEEFDVKIVNSSCPHSGTCYGN